VRKQTQESRKTVWIALAANASIMIAKGIAGIVTGSAALLAEAAHSVADTCDQGLMLLALSRSERPPDEDHPFGYGKERFFWTLLVAILIFAFGGVFSILEGLYRILSAGGEQGYFVVSYAVLGIALLAEGTSLARAVRQTRASAREAELDFAEFVRTSKEPTVKTVLSEDTGAVIGVLIALAGTVLGQLTGDKLWDGAAAVVIGGLLCLIGYALARDTKGLLIGAPARPDERERLRRTILEHDGVDDVLELLTMYVGPHSALVAARIDLRDDLTGDEVEQLSNRVDAALREELPDVTDVFLDATPRGTREA
jgi:cation diffusion facilitator family transporter